MLAEFFMPRRRSGEDESIGDFVRRRFGRECLERAGQAMLAGIYTGDPDTLGILATLPHFREWERRYGSVLRGLWKEKRNAGGDLEKTSGPRYGLFVSFKAGMQTLTDVLSKKIPSGTFRLNTAVKKISWDASKNSWRIGTTPGEVLNAHVVCCALPARATKEIFKENLPEISDELSKIRYESVAIVHLAYRDDQCSRLPEGFGFVTPRVEKRAVIACTFVDQKFEGRAPKGFKLLRAFVGGAFGSEHYEKRDSELLEEAEKDIRALAGVDGKPLFRLLQRHPASMVQYSVGHLDWLDKVRRLVDAHTGLFLTGASYGGVGIPDCVHDAAIQAEKIVEGIDAC